MAGGSASLKVFVEGMLERVFLYSLVDVEMQVENFVLLPEGKLGFHAVPPFVGVPPDGYYETLQYTACSVSGDISRALKTLSRLLAEDDSLALEQDLTAKLSSLQPELGSKVHSASLNFFENSGRALAASGWKVPLFLLLFHRNFAFVLEHCEALHVEEDLVKEAMCPVLGRVLRFHASDLLATKKSQDWLFSSFLLAFSAMRQAEVAMEQTRETEPGLARVVERKQAEFLQAQKNRRTKVLVRTAMMLVGFFLLVQILINADNSLLQVSSGTAAAFLAFAVYRGISRME
jgi:hypothetical protein